MAKLTLTLGNCYLVTFPDNSTLVFKFLGADSDLLIEINGEIFLFRDKVAIWISIEEVHCN